VRCPHCKNVIRLREVDGQSRVIKYLCSNCQEIVRIDLLQDEVKSSSSADSFEKTEHKKKILVADDTVTVRKVAARLLAAAGYDVLEAEDGRQALDMVQNEHPDLILLDLLMPKMTGFDVLREIQEDRSGQDDADPDHERCLQEGRARFPAGGGRRRLSRQGTDQRLLAVRVQQILAA